MILPVRKSPRWSEYDYSSEGSYFITIVTKDRKCYFGEIRRDGLVGRPQMILNELGKYCEQEIIKINNRKNVEIHESVIMPNHIHLIICLTNFTNDMNIGYRRDGLVGRPQINDNTDDDNTIIGYRRDGLVGRPQINDNTDDDMNDDIICGRQMNDDIICGRQMNDDIICGRQMNDDIICGRATSASLQKIVKHNNYNGPLLGNIVNSFKGNVSKYANVHDIPFARQSRYHDHIIRNTIEYDRIKHYIQTNPENRKKDKFS